MKKYFWFLSAGLILAQGCIPLFIGAGVLAGYTLSNDSAAGNVKIEYHELWNSCRDILMQERGEILVSDESRGLIKAKIEGNSITLKISSITQSVQKLVVSARKNFLPKPQFAQKIFFDIIDQIK